MKKIFCQCQRNAPPPPLHTHTGTVSKTDHADRAGRPRSQEDTHSLSRLRGQEEAPSCLSGVCVCEEGVGVSFIYILYKPLYLFVFIRYLVNFLFFACKCAIAPLSQSTLCLDPVFLHHSSSLYHTQPEVVVFQEIVEAKALYMRTVSAVEEAWLPRIVPQYCTFSPPLDTPPPSCDPDTGTVRCHMTCTYGECMQSVYYLLLLLIAMYCIFIIKF